MGQRASANIITNQMISDELDRMDYIELIVLETVMDATIVQKVVPLHVGIHLAQEILAKRAKGHRITLEDIKSLSTPVRVA